MDTIYKSELQKEIDRIKEIVKLFLQGTEKIKVKDSNMYEGNRSKGEGGMKALKDIEDHIKIYGEKINLSHFKNWLKEEIVRCEDVLNKENVPACRVFFNGYRDNLDRINKWVIEIEKTENDTY